MRDDVIHECASHALAPVFRFNEQAVKFYAAALGAQECCKAQDAAVALCHEDMTVLDLLHWKVDDAGVCEQMRSVAFVFQRGSQLKGLETEFFGNGREAYLDRKHVDRSI